MKLLHGDCLDLLQTLPDGSVDAVIADPPYGTTACKWDAVIPFAPMWAQLRRVAKLTAVFVFTASQPFTSALVMSNPREFRHEWIWKKERGSNFANTVREPFKEHESVLVFSRGRWTYNRQMQERSAKGAARVKLPFSQKTVSKSENYRVFGHGDRRVTGVLRVPSSLQEFKSDRGLHPTQKPADLFAYLIRTYTNPGETVLDFCAGSFTTAVACLREGRDCIAIEREAGYFAIGQRRVAEEERRMAAAQPSLFAEVAD
jgi:site-specific DNA-methyltransferase (adenine-specific)